VGTGTIWLVCAWGRPVERDGLADLLAGRFDVILFVDRRALDLQEEAAAASEVAARSPRRAVVVQQFQRLGSHLRQ
jgi:hypothetical protein